MLRRLYAMDARRQNAFLACALTAGAHPSAPVAGVRPIDLAGPEDAIATCVIRLARAAPGIVKTVLAGKQPAPLTLKELTPPSPVARRYRGSRAKSRGGSDCAVPYPREPVLVRMAACPVQNSSPHLPRIALRSLLSGPPLPSRPFSSIHLSRMSLSALDRLERLPSPSSRNDSFPDAGARARRHL